MNKRLDSKACCPEIKELFIKERLLNSKSLFHTNPLVSVFNLSQKF